MNQKIYSPDPKPDLVNGERMPCFSGKLAYRSQAAARQCYRRMKKTVYEGLVAYHCHHCDFWHLGHPNKEKSVAPMHRNTGRKLKFLIKEYIAAATIARRRGRHMAYSETRTVIVEAFINFFHESPGFNRTKFELACSPGTDIQKIALCMATHSNKCLCQ